MFRNLFVVLIPVVHLFNSLSRFENLTSVVLRRYGTQIACLMSMYGYTISPK